MTDQPKTALDQFLAAAKRIEAIHSDVKSARGIPDRVGYDIDKVAIRVETGSYWNQNIPPLAAEAAKRIKDQVAAEFRADAEHERDAKLHALAVEMETIRAALPSLAAQASIELGHQARMLAYEANGGAL
ncbi:hypothetical protein [Bosea minatitlanensis]|uniref:Uncharacterized protein n=1 Tax=Bosea minatitlanensis TaxID=128782 RepID=A0ABW0EZQ4_9HYPH|nr:hypothetical protein [Bosea minatitlanensis]MCT4492771.1 hypothetical protein [Bosea minatitlanensis]